MQAAQLIRYVPEDAAVGAEVGPPVTAVDDNDANDDNDELPYLLTYSLGPVAVGANPTATEIAAAAPFDINPATGQIITNRVLDFNESLDSPIDPGAQNEYTTNEVVVTATDPDGQELSIRVNIRITDADEAPLFNHDLTREAIVMENSLDAARHIGTYNPTASPPFATDPEGTTPIIREIGGADADAFAFEIDTLQFDDDFVIDFERPGDANGDNLYELTVVAEDQTGMVSSLAVTVKVTDDATDNKINASEGTIEIFNRQPELSIPLKVTNTATTPLEGSWTTMAG